MTGGTLRRRGSVRRRNALVTVCADRVHGVFSCPGWSVKRRLDGIALGALALSSLLTAAGAIPAVLLLHGRSSCDDCSGGGPFAVIWVLWVISGGCGVVFAWLLEDLSVQARDDLVLIRIFGTAIAAFNAVPALFVNHWTAHAVAALALVAALLQASLAIAE